MDAVTLNEALAAGFSRAHRRIGAIVLDLTWKALWLAFTSLLFLVAILWINFEIGPVEVNGGSLNNPIALVVLARQIWARYGSALRDIILVLILAAALAGLL